MARRLSDMRVFFCPFNGLRNYEERGTKVTAKKTKLKELILKAQGGDKDALNQVIERFKPTLL
ncbi:hypothetical protein D2962_14290 [Biomaibacter acetigenes]|jgi:hypothetical protein|uniref:Helix-turn-helix conjugative transposon-like domain-containing protein n=1 Tax=Biomaibacter acetigenes TaxID=2316383 RepID=A0A3G2R8B3_9FIRM|nr:hypothetical protein D2962_14290 [Biomaibacter acetigenes]RKL62979.1 hypothetical protein DXT63_08245 [Thermoanaerobacteraceae bacterium SP2]